MIRRNEPFVQPSDDAVPGDELPLAIPNEHGDADEEIYCPVCAYNLTGVLSGRCPECGAFFDREALIATQKLHAITLIPWDDPEPTRRQNRFWATLKVCLFVPERFAHAFSVQPQRSRAISFFLANWALLALALLVFGFAATLIWRWDEWLDCFTSYRRAYSAFVTLSVPVVWPLFGTTGVMVLTSFLWAITLTIFCPHFDGKRHFRPWFSIACYANAHFLLLPAWILPICLLIAALGFEDLSYPCAVSLGWAGCGLLNFATLWAVIKKRTAKTTASSFVFVMLLLSLIAAAAASIAGSGLLIEAIEDFWHYTIYGY